MSELLSRNVLLFAGEMFVLSAIVLALAWEAAHLFRNRAALRHLVWLGAFAALTVVPALTAVLPSHIHFMLAAPSLSQPVVLAQDMDVAPADIRATAPVTAVAETASAPSFHLDIALAARAISLLWLAGVLVIALRGIFALFGLRALKRRSRVYAPDAIDLPQGRYEIRIARDPNNFGPLTWGILRPIILLPFQAQFWPCERLQAVLMHEVAHIRRRDSLSQLLSMLVCALYWPNPLVWAAARSLRAEAEMAADDTVLASGVRASSYAGELLQLASEYRSREPALAGMPLFMAGSALETRVKSVLAPTPQRSGVTKMDVLKIGGVAVLAAAALTFARPTFAQEETPAAVATTPLPAAAASGPALVAQPAPPSPAPMARVEPAPPAPAVIAVPALQAHPVVNVRTTESSHHGRTVRHIWIDGRALSPEEMARMHAEIQKAEAAVARARPQIDQARIELRAHEAELRMMAEQRPLIEARVQAALDKVRPEIEKALADPDLRDMDLKIHTKVDRALKNAEIRIKIVDRNEEEDGAARDRSEETPERE